MQLAREIAAHLKEFGRAIRNHKWEQHDNGILIPSAHIILGGQYATRVNKGPWGEWERNLVPTEGLNFILDLVGNNVAAAAAYIALYANALTPIAAHTAASFTATYSEIVSGSEGYTEATRVLWNTGAAASSAVNNNSVPAEFTIATATTLTVNGVALLTASAKSATTGKLVSASRFAATRTFSDTDLFDVKYQLGGTSS